MKPARVILLLLAMAAAAVASGWWLLSSQPGAAIEAYRNEHLRLKASEQQRLPPADAFRATACADTRCVVVEAGGLTFVFGAGSGAAEGIRRIGLMHANIDGVLLPDLDVETVEGLATLAAAEGQAGRKDPLKVFGPSGLVPVVDGANLTVSATQQSRVVSGIEGVQEAGGGRIVFDSGVVTVRGFGGAERGMGRVYRIDFDGRSLILAGCSAVSRDLVSAARETQRAGVIVMAGAERLIGRVPACSDIAPLAKALEQSRILAGVVVPVEPPLANDRAQSAWRELLASIRGVQLDLARQGATLDMSGEAPRFTSASQK